MASQPRGFLYTRVSHETRVDTGPSPAAGEWSPGPDPDLAPSYPSGWLAHRPSKYSTIQLVRAFKHIEYPWEEYATCRWCASGYSPTTRNENPLCLVSL